MDKTIDEGIMTRLQEIVGPENVLSEASDIEPYSHDETPGLRAFPEVVVKPAEKKEIVEVLRLANKKKVPLTPRGGGTGLSGGAIPLKGGIVLSLERMNRILDIDTANSMAVLQAGVINGEFRTLLSGKPGQPG